MEPESDGPDPREAKIFADILALVLQDEPGPSAVALDTLRRKAQQNRVTGGALKNLFQSITGKPLEFALRGRVELYPESPDALRDGYDRLRATNHTLERALAAANMEAARLQSDLDEVQSRLIEAHQHNRGVAERWRAARKQVTYMAAAIGGCMLVIVGLTVDRLVRPAASVTIAAPLSPPRVASPPAKQARVTPGRIHAEASSRAPPGRAADPAPSAGAPERDLELEQALMRLSRGTPAATAPAPAPSVPARPPPVPAPAMPLPATLPASASAPANAVGHLPPDVYSTIIAHVRGCWRGYVSQLPEPRFKARLEVITDESGVVREAQLASEERPQLANPSFQSFVRAAMHSVLDPDCAQLPIPPANLGHKIAFDFVFVP